MRNPKMVEKATLSEVKKSFEELLGEALALCQKEVDKLENINHLTKKY